MSQLSLRSIRRQFFIAYALMGSVQPFLTPFLKGKGLSETQIGYILGAASIAVMLTPGILALLADMRVDSRLIMAGVFVISSGAVAGLYFAHTFWLLLLLCCLQSLAYVAVLPLLDALNFTVQQQRTDAGKVAIPYNRMRVWGTLGYILPGMLLYFLLSHQAGSGLWWPLALGVAFALIGSVNSLRLPSPICDKPAPQALGGECDDSTLRQNSSRFHQLPTVEAARALLRPPVLVFCLGMFLFSAAASAFGGFFSLYLTREMGIAQQWIGPINNVAVVFEIFFVLSFSWFLDKLGFKWLMALGFFCLALRLAAVALFPYPPVVIVTQLTHGMMLLAAGVAPMIYLNQQAHDRYRNSIQGLYTVAVLGTSRVLGSVVAGYIAQQSLRSVFISASVVALLAAALMTFAFHDELKTEIVPQTA